MIRTQLYHLINEEAESQKSQVIFPRTQSKKAALSIGGICWPGIWSQKICLNSVSFTYQFCDRTLTIFEAQFFAFLKWKWKEFCTSQVSENTCNPHVPDSYKCSIKMFFSGTFQDQNRNVQIPSPNVLLSFPFTNPEIITMFSLITLDT